jgi:hypothetical protein
LSGFRQDSAETLEKTVFLRRKFFREFLIRYTGEDRTGDSIGSTSFPVGG